MKNCLKLSKFSKAEINEILDLAQDIIDGSNKNKLDGKIVANLFFETSTRTQYSFNTAEEKLNCKVINFNQSASSMLKGETFYDTIKTFDSFGVDALVIRSAQNEWYKEIEGKVKAQLINGGDGTLDHPTQTLLDLLTIKQEFGTLSGLKVLIVGDIAHSRVAHSNVKVFKKMGMIVQLAAPKQFQEKKFKYVDFDKTIGEVDVINLLRIQNERIDDIKINTANYNKKFGMNKARVKKMKAKAIIIHPAPFNRGVELTDDVVECKQSRIYKQMQNGVYVRMAVLLKLLGEK